MRVYKCDRCGKVVEVDMIAFFLRYPRILYCFGRKKHLCRDCKDSFRRWFYNPKAKEESDAVR